MMRGLLVVLLTAALPVIALANDTNPWRTLALQGQQSAANEGIVAAQIIEGLQAEIAQLKAQITQLQKPAENTETPK